MTIHESFRFGLPLQSRIYRIVKDALNKINDGYWVRPSLATMRFLWEYLAYCAGVLGYNETAFEAQRERWLLADSLRDRAIQYSNLLMAAQYLDFSSEDMFELHRVYGEILAEISPYRHDLTALTASLRANPRKIRIGYISPDCRHHVAYRFFSGLLVNADHDKFEIYVPECFTALGVITML